jgi:Domain of unknown function (DUF4304)
MKKVLVKAIRKELGSGLKRIAPAFAAASDALPSAFGLYESELSDNLRAYIMFQAHRKEDSFTIEVASTRNGKWPEYYVLPPPALHELSPQGDIRFRLGLLWGETNYWWRVRSESREATVTDALERLQRYALPYFRSMGEQRETGPASAGVPLTKGLRPTLRSGPGTAARRDRGSRPRTAPQSVPRLGVRAVASRWAGSKPRNASAGVAPPSPSWGRKQT